MDRPEVGSALLGAWSVLRRECDGRERFQRIRFFRGARFATLALDGMTVVHGSWSLGDTETDTTRALSGRLALRFDGHDSPSIEYRAVITAPPLGPLALVDRAAGATSVRLTRPAGVDGGLVGAWNAPTGNAVLDGLELRADGHFVERLTGGVTHAGLWEFEAASTARGVPREGTLVLDPLERVFPVTRWPATLTQCNTAELVLHMPEGPLKLSRRRLDALEVGFVANWRFVGPADAPIARELRVHRDGTIDVVIRPGAPIATGRWTLANTSRHADAVEATLVLTVHAPGRPNTLEQWHARLPFALGADLALRSERGGEVRYRRLFR